MGATASSCCSGDGSAAPRGGGRLLLRKTPGGSNHATAFTNPARGQGGGGSEEEGPRSVMVWTAEDLCCTPLEEGHGGSPRRRLCAPLCDMGPCEMRPPSSNQERVIVHLRTPPPSSGMSLPAVAEQEDAELAEWDRLAGTPPTQPAPRVRPSSAKAKRLPPSPASPATSGQAASPPESPARRAPLRG